MNLHNKIDYLNHPNHPVVNSSDLHNVRVLITESVYIQKGFTELFLANVIV